MIAILYAVAGTAMTVYLGALYGECEFSNDRFDESEKHEAEMARLRRAKRQAQAQAQAQAQTEILKYKGIPVAFYPWEAR